ncbi:MAG: phosphoribosylglycinamide formyltransferase [Deltaproteobacteria bacterium]|nr:phosphoribosylglycinamide formyltransferase [Deltaproteobacteria bacterium]
MPDSKKLKIAVLVSGRGSNLQAIIDAQKNGQIDSHVTMVFSNKEKAPALKRASDAKIPCTVIPSSEKENHVFQSELLQAVADEGPDLIVLAGFMRILSSDFISTFQGRIINIHPSLLPAFPGLHAVRQALAAGVKLTGCTVHFVDDGCDTGPIILQTAENILDTDDESSLAARLLQKEHQTLIKAIRLLEQNKVVLSDNKTRLREGL